MRAKMGNGFPKKGNSLPLMAAESQNVPYEKVIAGAVRRELGGSHQAVKTLMKRTGASARTAKNWLAGSAGPTGSHLVELMRSSDLVFEAVLRMAGRSQAIANHRLAEAQDLLRRAELLLRDGH
jgi:hypothetical protein